MKRSVSATRRRRLAPAARTSAPLGLAALIAVVALAATATGAAGTTHTTTPTPTTSTSSTTTAGGGHSLLASRVLWATVDVCDPHDQTDTIGIRGSMPGDGSTGETMFMRFRVQYRDATTGQWLDISAHADSGYVNVGSARYRVREAGRSFVFLPGPHTPAYRLRGVVIFQWRHGTTVVRSATRDTQAGHVSAAGADPKNYSASTCVIP